MGNFKFRAETDRDVIEFIRITPEAKNFSFEYPNIKYGILECSVTFESYLDSAAILERIQLVEDSHVMQRTLEEF